MVLVQLILFFKSSWGKIAIAWHAKKWIYTAPQAAATTFAFSSVFILYTSIYAPTTWGKTKLIIVPALCHKENKCLLLLPIFYFLSLWTICFLFISFLTAFFSNIYILDIYIILYISMNNANTVCATCQQKFREFSWCHPADNAKYTKIPASKNVYCIILLQFCTLGRSKNSKAVKENARFSSK